MKKYYVRIKNRPLIYFDDIEKAKKFAKDNGVKFRIPRKQKKLG